MQFYVSYTPMCLVSNNFVLTLTPSVLGRILKTLFRKHNSF